MGILGRTMEHYRMAFYVGFCTLSVWCITNTPIGELVLRQKKYVVIPPENTTPEHEAVLRDQIMRACKENSSK